MPRHSTGRSAGDFELPRCGLRAHRQLRRDGPRQPDPHERRGCHAGAVPGEPWTPVECSGRPAGSRPWRGHPRRAHLRPPRTEPCRYQGARSRHPLRRPGSPARAARGGWPDAGAHHRAVLVLRDRKVAGKRTSHPLMAAPNVLDRNKSNPRIVPATCRQRVLPAARGRRRSTTKIRLAPNSAQSASLAPQASAWWSLCRAPTRGVRARSWRASIPTKSTRRSRLKALA